MLEKRKLRFTAVYIKAVGHQDPIATVLKFEAMIALDYQPVSLVYRSEVYDICC